MKNKIQPLPVFISYSLFLLSILAIHPAASIAQSPDAYAVFSDSSREQNQFSGSIHIGHVDTLSTSQIEITIGTAENDTTLLNLLVDFDNPASLPQGFAYYRNKDDFIIDVSGPHASWTYFCRMRIKDPQGNWSAPYFFLAN